ncbi:MAG: hypothetical protein ABL934_06230 [Lysobacteraceae bacterium]
MQKIFIALTLIVLSIPATALAAFGYQYPGYVTMTLNSAETELTIFWSSGAYSYDQNRGCLTDPNGAPFFRLSLDGNIIRQESLSGKLRNGQGFPAICTYTFVLSYGGNNKISAGTYQADFGLTIYSGYQSNASKTSSVAACTPLRGKRPIYLSNNGVYTDYFYTLSYSDSQLSTNFGYGYMGTPFSMPYPEPEGTVSFSRYFKGAPQLEHFYSTNTSEAGFLIANGYIAEGIEGNVYSRPRIGTAALHRYATYNPANGDLYHYYTIHANDAQTQGMQYEGVVGYVCPAN